MRREIPHHTDEQVREAVSKAVALVDELVVPADLRAAAFEQACQMFAAKQILMQEPAPIAGRLALPGL